MSYYENYPLLPVSPSRQLFEDDLRKCIELCNQKPYSENYEAESLLTNLCARGLLLTYYTNNNLSMSVIPLTAGTYKYLKKSFDFVSVFADFYFFTGTYNYYWEAYPRIHTIYRTLASLFPPGDMKQGLYELLMAAQQSIFVQVESYSRLTSIYTGFENNYFMASVYSKTLTDHGLQGAGSRLQFQFVFANGLPQCGAVGTQQRFGQLDDVGVEAGYLAP